MDDKELLNLACLRAVREVAETGSASRAAAALFRAQSAITRAVQEIESALGEPLFDRKPTGMLPTPVGRTVLKRSERVFDELNALARWCAARQSRRRAPPVERRKTKKGAPKRALCIDRTKRLSASRTGTNGGPWRGRTSYARPRASRG